MIILKFSGGLGNQLFIYAMYKKLELLGKEVKADITNYTNGIDKRQFELEKVGIKIRKATVLDYIKIQDSFTKVIEVIKHAIRGHDYSFVKEPIRTFVSEYFGEAFDVEDSCLIGYWQNIRYFIDAIDDIRESIVFSIKNEKINQVEKKMRESNSVSVHIRLTDYLTCENFAGICNEKYYENALLKIKEEVENPIFYIFSDDIENAKKIMNKYDDIVFLDQKNASYEDLFLMSSCKHHIMANSSFSWWGTVLSRHKDGIVLAPDKWTNDNYEWNIYLDSWMKIPTQ